MLLLTIVYFQRCSQLQLLSRLSLISSINRWPPARLITMSSLVSACICMHLGCLSILNTRGRTSQTSPHTQLIILPWQLAGNLTLTTVRLPTDGLRLHGWRKLWNLLPISTVMTMPWITITSQHLSTTFQVLQSSTPSPTRDSTPLGLEALLRQPLVAMDWSILGHSRFIQMWVCFFVCLFVYSVAGKVRVRSLTLYLWIPIGGLGKRGCSCWIQYCYRHKNSLHRRLLLPGRELHFFWVSINQHYSMLMKLKTFLTESHIYLPYLFAERNQSGIPG